MILSKSDIQQRLETVVDPKSGQHVVAAGLIEDIQVVPLADDLVDVVIVTRDMSSELEDACRQAVQALEGVNQVTRGTRPADPGAEGAVSGGQAVGQLSEQVVYEELKKVIDPELFVNIVDLGLIYEVTLSDAEDEKKDVHINMTMTSPMCPAGPQMIANSKQVLGQLPEVGNVEVKIVLDPPWTPEKMTDDARDQLGIF